MLVHLVHWSFSPPTLVVLSLSSHKLFREKERYGLTVIRTSSSGVPAISGETNKNSFYFYFTSLTVTSICIGGALPPTPYPFDSFAPCKGIREIFVCGIWNARNVCLWNPESWALKSRIQLKESVTRIQVPLTKNRNPAP